MSENNNPSIQMTNTERILEVKHLKKFFPITKGFRKKHVGDVGQLMISIYILIKVKL